MQGEARCALHPDRPALLACARCGTFVCSGCVVSGDLCVECRSRLFREGVPYGKQERARASARRHLRIATWLLRILTSSGAAGLLALLGDAAGAGPALLAPIGWGLLCVASASGLGAAVSTGWGFVQSRRGRPGPALPGVLPGPTAALLIALGLAPALLLLLALLGRARGQ